jgi:hypothetical protein
MAAPELMYRQVRIDTAKLSKVEIILIEAELLLRLYSWLKEFFRDKLKNFFILKRFTIEMENNMLDHEFISNIINDILITQQYTIEGIASYTQSHEEVIIDILTGKNSDPSFYLARKLIDLHRSVRPKLYTEIFKNITAPHM